MLRSLLVLILLPGLASCAPAERPGIPPQHVFLRADHMSAFMYERRTTFAHGRPEAIQRGRTACLDELLAQGVVFASAFAPSGRSAPSLASLLTGHTPLQTGVLDDGDELGAGLPTLSSALAAEGFLTLAFVSDPDGALATLTRRFESARTAPDDRGALAAVAEWASTFDFGSERRVLLWLHLSELDVPFPAVRVPGAPDFLADFTNPYYAGSANGSEAYLASVHAGEVPLDDDDVARVVAHYDAELAGLHHLFMRLLDYNAQLLRFNITIDLDPLYAFTFPIG